MPSVVPDSPVAANSANGSKHVPWNVVFVLGPPGSGKGTQCQRIADELGFVHLSAGDLLRAERSREGSQYGPLIVEHIRNGTIVPVEITCALLEEAMKSNTGAQGFLIDGFPRNKDNNDGWRRLMSSKTNVRFVLFIECPKQLCVTRCLGRNQGRADDNEDSLKKRIETYSSQTMPIVNLYESEGLVRKVNGAKEPDEVFEEIRSVFAEAGVLR